ncbi:MAG: tRNA (N(6)-L-threonylcarbamoyladenosine(37)-C(2))-methylthiotransferase MtaB [Candidatus Rokubacteria bacterium]|nr:tRNA (N(6)-L-threonylcarbamoyladenosine(37)-C(2))-methylthiotransferase MtaB [Candidatus Rokubacteria bacterium]
MTGTVAFATLGCRLNQVDTQEMQARLETRGFRTVPFEEPADVVVVNSCTVTARADFSDRQMVRRAARQHPGARVVVTGCWAQTSPAEAVATGADLVVGNADKHRIDALIASLVTNADRATRVAVSDIRTAGAMPVAPLARTAGRSRAFLKVQEGCQHRCAFCIVPRARGVSRSQHPEIVVDQVRRLVDAGHPEVVLTGVDLGHYGADLTPATTLAALLRRIGDIEGLRWVRLSSVLPAYFTPELVDVVTGAPRIAPHLHIPLQSGSDRVLRRMRRPYTVRRYRAIVERLATRIPDLGLGTDLIVGFPGESDGDFADTMRVVDELPFSYLHVFAYSDRRETEAAAMPDHLAARTVTRRSAVLRARSDDKARAFRAALVDRSVEALVLETRDRATGGLIALTGHYVEIVFDGPDSLMRRLVHLRVTAAGDERARGELE